MADIIFYGAGNYTQLKLFEWENKVGTPVCFADNNPQKWHTKFPKIAYVGGEPERYDVLPPDEVFAAYPDADIYITVFPGHYKKVFDFLKDIKKIPESRIKTPQELKYRVKSCCLLGNSMEFGAKRFTDCCGNFDVKLFPYQSPMHGWTSEIAQFWGDFMTLFDKGNDAKCDKCSISSPGYYYAKPELSEVKFTYGFKGENCNLRCNYCVAGYQNDNDTKRKQLAADLRLSDLLEFLEKDSESHEQLKYINTVIFSASEPTLLPDIDKILNIVRKKRVRVLLYTNATIYNQKLAELLASGYGFIRVSIDAGTRETYKKVKGVDLFDKARDNLLRYSPSRETPSEDKPIQLKYIFCKDNCTYEDIDGFFDIAKQIRCEIIISLDDFNRELYDRIKDWVVYFIKSALSNGLLVSSSTLFRHVDEEIKRLKNEFCDANISLLKL
jgi:pyruvate-formate lyase-activating enzyme